MRFDPMTGEPIQQMQDEKEPEMRFDPMTGEPIRQTTYEKEPEMRFDPMTGKPLSGKGKGSKRTGFKAAVCVAVAAVVVVIGVVAVQAVPRIVYGKNYKLLRALRNTFTMNNLMENLNPTDIISGGNFTVIVNGDIEGVEMDTTLAIDAPAEKLSCEGNVSYQGFGTDFAVGVNEGEILVSIPDFSDQMLRYSYVEEKDGYLVDLLENVGIDVEEVDEVLHDVVAQSYQDEGSDRFVQATIQATKVMDFEKTDKRKVEVNGKERNCRGYTLEIDEDLMSDICDIYEDAIDTYMEDEGIPDEIADEVDMLMDDIRDEAELLDGEISFYLYKKQVAAIVCEISGNEVVVEFHGGSTPWENTELLVEDYETLELSGSADGKTEELQLKMFGEKIFEYDYDLKTGELEVDADGLTLEGTVKKDRKNCTYILSDLKMYGNRAPVTGSIVFEKGADVKRIKPDEVMDIGNLSKNEWIEWLGDIGEEFTDSIYGLIF